MNFGSGISGGASAAGAAAASHDVPKVAPKAKAAAAVVLPGASAAALPAAPLEALDWKRITKRTNGDAATQEQPYRFGPGGARVGGGGGR